MVYAAPVKRAVKTPAPADPPLFPSASRNPALAYFSSWKKIARYGETQVLVFLRDPHCLYTYWEITPDRVESVRREWKGEFEGSFLVLRLFKTGHDGQPWLVEEVRVEPGERNRYLELKEPGGNYFVEIAQKAPSGLLRVYARSKLLATYAAGDSFWASSIGSSWEQGDGLQTYFDKIIRDAAGGTPAGISSAENQERKNKIYRASRF